MSIKVKKTAIQEMFDFVDVEQISEKIDEMSDLVVQAIIPDETILLNDKSRFICDYQFYLRMIKNVLVEIFNENRDYAK